MNRLTGITLKRASGQNLYCSMTYDALGRMTSRQAVTAVNGSPKVTSVFSRISFHATKTHALTLATTSSGMFPSTPQTVTYTSFDKVSMVKQGNDSLCYTYGYDHRRILMEEHAGVSLHTKRYVGNCEYVTDANGNITNAGWVSYLTGPLGVFAVVTTRNGNNQIHYVLKDNLGNWTTVTDGNGLVEQQLSFDPWGNLRNPNNWANYPADDFFNHPMFDRGFTGHEHLTDFGLVNMNGRVYDPVVCSFLSADRYIQNPMSTQGFNRYAYCMYNPLRYVDPSGWLSGGGGGGPGNPLPRVVVDGFAGYLIPEVTILPDNPSLSNTYEYEEYEYTPNITSGGFDIGRGSTKGWSSSGHNGGSGGGNGNHGGRRPAQKVSGEVPPTGMTIHTGNYLFIKAYWHYQFGRKRDFWVDASTLDLYYISFKDLTERGDGTYWINLFDYSKTDQIALALGKIDLTPLGNNQYEIKYDRYDFNMECEQGLTIRNKGTFI